MMRFLTDENFDNDILRGVVRRLPHLDIARVQDLGLAGRLDAVVLEHAAQEGRVLLTHDVNTMVAEGYQRVAAGLPMPGLFALPQSVPVGEAIEEIVLLVECSLEGEWEEQVRFLPLRG